MPYNVLGILKPIRESKGYSTNENTNHGLGGGSMGKALAVKQMT